MMGQKCATCKEKCKKCLCCCRKKSKEKTPETPATPEETPEDIAYQLAKRQRKAAITIQKWWRGLLVRRTLQQAAIYVMIIQRWWTRVIWPLREERRLRALVKYTWSTKACVLLQSVIRMWLMRIQYKKYLQAVLVIQRRWRHYCFWKESSLCAGINEDDDGIDLNIEIIVE